MKAEITDLAKKNQGLRTFLRNLAYCFRKTRFFFRGIGVKTEETTVIFETFTGRNYSDTPKAIYEYMLKDERFKDYNFIWVLREPEKYSFLEENRNTRIVLFKYGEYEKALHRAKYWIFNYRALDHLSPKADQVYVQCWHGTPLKRLGYDISYTGNAMNSVKDIRKKYDIDSRRFKYLLSPCKFSTEKFRSAWNLKAIGKENAILELGYPRNDRIVNHTEEDIIKIKNKLGIPADKRVILYAPTWRDNEHVSTQGYVYTIGVDFDKLRDELADENVILFRTHYMVTNAIDLSRYEGFVYNVSTYDDINDLYIISDLLITDYSSVYFDFAITKRPVVFYMYDLEAYRDEIRGFYLGMETLPGPIVEKEEELISLLKGDEKSLVGNMEIDEFNATFNYLNDGKASERFVNAVFTEVSK